MGVLSAIGHYGLLITLVQVFLIAPVPASAAGSLLGAVINYSLNYRYTFRSTARHSIAISRFSVIALTGLILNSGLMWIGVELLGIHYLVAQVITTALILIWSYCGNRYWTFHT
jgi:putative flippase GtrA